MVALASAPLPLAEKLGEAAVDAAVEFEVIVASSTAVIVRSPEVVPIFADVAYASTSLSIKLWALEMPTETAAEAPGVKPMATATDTPTTVASMADMSLALTVTLSAL